ncbi:helix-turn-helix domain-containing protein [Periweissella fabalis]|uniref:Helix-turn-helix transcriptional regulator n=1 Tax=Periweissella fabalis TaxID=1070421 RepID=A0A7X6N1Z9_9LACO|nr:helix-turn-helix transcriptional regulator [Periweissella fabalis]MCM0598278.1 helix-turn-helix transcriptional regulator [Periweissella fabalis]NKZ23784.1 helix-turn-helix transcriptional regulator [Periweissella fabalis]
MGEYFGATVKKVREDKGFLMKEIYNDILPRSTAYRFEKDSANITFSQLREILRRLNIVSLDEFAFLRRSIFKNTSSDDELIVEYEAVVAARTNNLIDAADLSLAFYQRYQASSNEQAKYYAYLIHIDYLITNLQFTEHQLNQLPQYEHEFEYVQQRLMMVSEWTMTELEAFPLISWYFNDVVKQVLYRKFKLNFKRYATFYDDEGWETKYSKLLLYYFIGQIYVQNYAELVNNLQDLDQLYEVNQQLRLNNTLNYCLYIFVCGARAAYQQDAMMTQSYYKQFVTLQQTIAPDSAVLNYYQQFFKRLIAQLR